MKEFLVFQIRAPLSAWGDVAIGEMRPSHNEPGQSLIFGLLAAALGIDREDEQGHLSLRDGYALTVAVLDEGKLLRDYHTAQVPGRTSLKKRPHRIRADELNILKEDLNTILSTRDYRQDSQMLIVVEPKKEVPFTLQIISEKLTSPKYTLYLGRKSCALAAPLWPKIESAENALTACQDYLKSLIEKIGQEKIQWWDKAAQMGIDADGKPLRIERLHWSVDATSGVLPTLSVLRKDCLLSRKRWQFEDRIEHITLFPEEI